MPFVWYFTYLGAKGAGHTTDDVGSVIQQWIAGMTGGTEEILASYVYAL